MQPFVRCSRILIADDEPRPKAWSKPRRRLPYHLMVANAGGEELLQFDHQTLRIGSGMVYLVSAGTPFALGCEWGNQPCFVHFDAVHDEHSELRRRWLWDRDPLGQTMPAPSPHPGLLFGAAMDLRPPPSIEAECHRRLRQVVRRWSGGDELAVAEAEHALEGLLLLWARSVRRLPDAAAHHQQRIERAEALARESLDQAFGVRAFAAAAGLRRSHFHAIYRELRGEAPSDFLARLRLERAQALLADGETIAAVAEACGYNDRSAFSRAFQRHCGSSPGQWQQRWHTH